VSELAHATDTAAATMLKQAKEAVVTLEVFIHFAITVVVETIAAFGSG
jgi:hypothetical protein